MSLKSFRRYYPVNLFLFCVFFLLFLIFHRNLNSKFHVNYSSFNEDNQFLETSNSLDFNNRTKYILIVSYFESGSSILGDIIQQVPMTFYFYEPLGYYSVSERITWQNMLSAMITFKNIYDCSFNTENELLNYLRDPMNSYHVDSMKDLKRSCGNNITHCTSPEVLDKICSRSNIRLIKTVRLPLEGFKLFMERLNEHVDFKVIWVTRDPRGMLYSRSQLDWCVRSPCIDSEILCNDMSSDLEAFMRFTKDFPDKFFVVRYEDICLEPVIMIKKIFELFRIPWNGKIKRYIGKFNETDLESELQLIDGPESQKMSDKWTHDMEWESVELIQKGCSNVLDKLGYRIIKEETKNRSMTLQLTDILMRNVSLVNLILPG